MNKKIVQDDIRQDYMINLFQLNSGFHREGIDAFLDNWEFELKSTSKGSVSTARDLGFKHLEKWKTRYWLIGNFKNTIDGFYFENFYLLTPQKMNIWYEKIKIKLENDKTIKEEVLNILSERNIPNEMISRVNKLMDDGALLNDPNIPKKFIQNHGILIVTDYANELRNIMKELNND